MQIETLAVGPLQVNCFIIECEKTKEALVVDPGEDGPYILNAIEEKGLTLKTIVNTHGHFDHIGANSFLVEKTGAKLLLHSSDLPIMQRAEAHAGSYGLPTTPSPEPTGELKDGDKVTVGELEFEVIHTPGHSPGGCCLFGEGHLFCGDSLFAGSIGRTDLPGGDHELLIEKVKSKLLSLPEDTCVHPGHGPDTTVGREKKMNPFVGE